MIRIISHKKFEKQFSKLDKDLKEKVRERLRLFVHNPNFPA